MVNRMTKYIECDAAIEAALSCTDPLEPIEVDTTVESIVWKLRKLPIADVQPIVRCKDCKHFHLDYFEEVYGMNIIVAHEICDFWAGGCKTTQDAFCSNGERKGGK